MNRKLIMKTKEDIIKLCGSNPNIWDWKMICSSVLLSEDFIREFQDKLNWAYTSTCQILSEDFIKEFQDKVDWDIISAKQVLSEEFVREFQDKVRWDYISAHQKLSEEFVDEFKDKIDIFFLIRNKYCPINIKSKYYIDRFQKNIENNEFTKEDSSKHSIEYSEKIEIEDDSLNKLKKLIE
jgi:hypothetical protein